MLLVLPSHRSAAQLPWHGVHVVDAHIRDTIHIDFCIQHQPLKIFMADQLRQQPVVELPGLSILSIASSPKCRAFQLCVWVIFCFCQTPSGNRRIPHRTLQAPRIAEGADVLCKFVRLIFAEGGTGNARRALESCSSVRLRNLRHANL